MGFARKVKRRNMPKVHCCGRRMTRKMGYDTETHDFYFCACCGKEKWVERPNCGADMRKTENETKCIKSEVSEGENGKE